MDTFENPITQASTIEVHKATLHLSYSPQLIKKAAENPILIISSTIVIPFLFARLSRNFRVIGGWAQYCNASKNMVMMAGVVNVSAAAPPMIAIGLMFSAVLLAVAVAADVYDDVSVGTYLAIVDG